MIPLSLFVIVAATWLAGAAIYFVGYERGHHAGAGEQQESLWKR
jgi:hypothetical protein